MSKTVMLEREDVMEQIRRAIAESGIPEGERVLVCSQRLGGWLIHALGTRGPAGLARELGAQMLPLVYLDDRKIIVTDRETARKLSGTWPSREGIG